MLMPDRRQVDEALELARGLLDDASTFSFRPSGLTELMRRYSTIEFDVPDVSDADGYLFQYGKAGWFTEPTFVLSLARQLEVVGPSGGHEHYIQVQFEFRYPLDGELENTGSCSEWWFPGDKISFDMWLESVAQAPIMNVLADKKPREFEIWQDQA
ncbi:hypothetical protein [Nonomuraea rubra]|uniref:hypothetical protein n=1 Tax=Nonomuraea rubra TaxID=46180 RepID=UPI0033E52390